MIPPIATPRGDCRDCLATGWVCERHPDRPWLDGDCGCGGSGVPCGCIPDGMLPPPPEGVVMVAPASRALFVLWLRARAESGDEQAASLLDLLGLEE